MKPYDFVKDVIKQLEVFNVKTVDFELHVGQNCYINQGDSVLKFTVDIPAYTKFKDAELNEMLGKL